MRHVVCQFVLVISLTTPWRSNGRGTTPGRSNGGGTTPGGSNGGGTTSSSIQQESCHDPPSLASGGGRLINSTAYRYWCHSGYSLQGFNYIYCINNVWVGPIPQCVLKYANPSLDTVIKVNREIKQGESLPEWFLMTILGCLGFAALSAIVTMLLCCLHMIGCYSGPVMSFGARHVYPKGPLCTCRDYCCCCCRCCKFCKMCCVGDEGDGEENIDEETKLSMIKNEDDNQYPEKSPEVQKEGNNVDHNKGKKSVQQDKTNVNKGQTAGPEEEK